MLKYIGNFEQLKDYGLVPEYDRYSGKIISYAKKWGDNNYKTVVNLNKEIKPDYIRNTYDTTIAYSREYLEEVLFNLIRDGLVEVIK